MTSYKDIKTLLKEGKKPEELLKELESQIHDAESALQKEQEQAKKKQEKEEKEITALMDVIDMIEYYLITIGVLKDGFNISREQVEILNDALKINKNDIKFLIDIACKFM